MKAKYTVTLTLLAGAAIGAADALKPIFGDGIILTSIAAVTLNAFFNRSSTAQAQAETFLAAQAAEHI